MAVKSEKLLVLKTKDEMLGILANWQVLHENLTRLDEETLKKLIQLEIQTKKRSQIVSRIHTRYTKVRSSRELTEYLSKLM